MNAAIEDLFWRSLAIATSLCICKVAIAAPPEAAMLDAARVRLLDGPFKQRQELHRTGYLDSWEVDKLLYHYRATAGLVQPTGVTSGYSGWDSGFIRGHMAGHYLSATSRMFAATGDTSIRDKANALVAGLKACQSALGTGHLAAFPESVLTAFESNGINTDLNITGGISVPYYTIHKVLAGLIDAHRYLGHQDALAMAVAMSDRYASRMATLTSTQVENLLRTDGSRNPHTEYGAMSDALLELAEITGDNRHRQLALVFIRDHFTAPLVAGQNNLYGLHANTHVAQTIGMARHARITGDATLGQAAENFWIMLTGPHAFANGGNSFNEWLDYPNVEAGPCIHNGAVLPYSTAETCNTHNMLKLTRQLFERSPEPRYADYFERALYNHILSSVDPDSGRVTYFHPHQGNQKIYMPETECCVGSGIENTARYGEGIYFHKDRTLWVNLYIPSELDWREQGLVIRQTGSIPYENTVTFTVMHAAAPVFATLKLRVPHWVAGRVSVSINGQAQAVSASPSSYLALTRTWSAGDTVAVILPAALRIESSKDVSSTKFVSYGPLLLAAKLGEEAGSGDIADKHGLAAQEKAEMPAVIVDDANPSSWLRLDDPVSLRFVAYDCGPASGLSFAPVHSIHHQKYAVYFSAMSPTKLATASQGMEIPRVGDGVSNFVGASSNQYNVGIDSLTYLAGDTSNALGQTFTTGNHLQGYRLSSISVRQAAYGPSYWDFTGGTVVLQLFAASGNPGTFAITPIATYSAIIGGEPDSLAYSYGSGGASPRWLTIHLPSPLALEPNRSYGFLLAANGTGLNDQFFIQTDGSSDDVLPGGFAVSNTYKDVDGVKFPSDVSATTLGLAGDRVFVASMSARTPYEAWCDRSGLDSSLGATIGFVDDSDLDGVANGIEWVLGGNPLQKDAADTAMSHIHTVADAFVFEFRRNPDSISSTSLVVEWDTDLDGPFAHSVPVGLVSASDPANGVTVTVDDAVVPHRITVRIPKKNALGNRLFARLKAWIP